MGELNRFALWGVALVFDPPWRLARGSGKLHLLFPKESTNQFVSSIKFLYLVTLEMPWTKEYFRHVRRPHKLLPACSRYYAATAAPPLRISGQRISCSPHGAKTIICAPPRCNLPAAKPPLRATSTTGHHPYPEAPCRVPDYAA